MISSLLVALYRDSPRHSNAWSKSLAGKPKCRGCLVYEVRGVGFGAFGRDTPEVVEPVAYEAVEVHAGQGGEYTWMETAGTAFAATRLCRYRGPKKAPPPAR